MDYNSRQTRERCTQTEAYKPLRTCTLSSTHTKPFQSPVDNTNVLCNTIHPCKQRLRHTRAKQALCIQGKQRDMSTARTVGGKQSQSTYCLSSIFPMSLGASSLIMGMCACVFVCM